MSLRNWLDNRWLVEHKPSPEEVADPLSVVERDLQDAVVDRISADWRLGIAYNAALQLAILALAAEGYRPERQRGRLSFAYSKAQPANTRTSGKVRKTSG